jgi:hypothetical protein
MAWPALADHRSGGDVQGREKAGCAMAFVIVGSPLGLARQHRKDRLTTAQRLDLTLLIHAQHKRMMRRIHVQAHDVPHLVDQQRIVGQLKRFAAMRTQTKRPPDATDRRLTQPGPCRRGETDPSRLRRWWPISHHTSIPKYPEIRGTSVQEKKQATER